MCHCVRMNFRCSITVFLTICTWLASTLPPFAASAAESAGPRLQIINGSAQTADVFWLKSATERVANGSIEPGRDLIITTTVGHRFVVVGRGVSHEAILENSANSFTIAEGRSDRTPHERL